MAFPEWWDWELELTPHVEKRMEDRGFTEVELREMLERAGDTAPMSWRGASWSKLAARAKGGRWLSNRTKWSIF